MEVIDKLIEQAPWAAALLAVVVVFIRFIRSESDKRESREKLHHETVSALVASFEKGTADCHDVQVKTIACVAENTVALKEVRSVLTGCRYNDPRRPTDPSKPGLEGGSV